VISASDHKPVCGLPILDRCGNSTLQIENIRPLARICAGISSALARSRSGEKKAGTLAMPASGRIPTATSLVVTT
jgi:hypothetical protein